MTTAKVGLDDFLLTHTADQFWALPEEEPTDWPTPAPLGDDLPPVEPCDLTLLPPSFRGLTKDISERMQVPMDFVAAAAIVALAGCVGRRAYIQPKEHDTQWKVFPNQWGGIVAFPGFKKSPVLQAVTEPLRHIEEMWWAEHSEAIQEFELEQEKNTLRIRAWEQKFKNAARNGGSEPPKPDTSVTEPTPRRLLVGDATVEKLQEILSVNPGGIFVSRDEMSGFISELDKPGREGARGFFLQGWNGDGAYPIDRIGRGTVMVPAVCISLFGLVQPARLRWYLSQMLNGGVGDDGLFQRFQVFVWPDAPPEWVNVDRPPDNLALATAEKVFSKLANLSADTPIQLQFDPEAQRLFFAWLAELEGKIRGDGNGLHPAFVSHLAKYRSLMPTLAGLFELADRVTADEELTSPVLISLAHAQQAAAFCDYLESHAHRIYSCLTTPELHAARELAKHIERGELGETFATRDVYFSHHWSGLDTAERARLALLELETAGWVRRVKAEATGGRPPETWQVNPKVGRRAK